MFGIGGRGGIQYIECANLRKKWRNRDNSAFYDYQSREEITKENFGNLSGNAGSTNKLNCWRIGKGEGS